MQFEEELVSVIIPVYNVEQYLDECMESVVHQSYCNIEIILVDDGSTDHSSQMCEKWKRTDDRICVIHQENKGLSGARNTGVQNSHGMYFVFVDSDDWIASDYIQELLIAIKENEADLAVCNHYNVAEKETVLIRQRIDNNIITSIEQKGEYLLHASGAMWNKIYRKGFYQQCVGKLPDIKYEDLAVFPIVLFGADKIVLLDKGLYFYRSDRQGSIMNNPNFVTDFPKAMEYGIRGVRERWKGDFADRYILLLHFKNIRYMLRHQGMDTKNAVSFRNHTECVLDRYFTNWQKYMTFQPLVFGSFNLRWIVQRIVLDIDDLKNYLGFTGLISQYTGKKLMIDVNCDHVFRKKMLEQDFQQTLRTVIQEGGIDYIFIDFMNEVGHSVAVTEEGYVLTESEAYGQMEETNMKVLKRYLYSDSEYLQLWKEACDKFVTDLERFGMEKVTLIRNRYAKACLSDGQMTSFQNHEEIYEKNVILEKMETYFLQIADGVRVIDIPDKLVYNAERRYESSPGYLNPDLYNYAAQEWIEGQKGEA